MKRVQLICLCAIAFIFAALSTGHGNLSHAQVAAEPAPASYFVMKNVMIPMRDGVRLATDIYLPAENGVRLDGKFPAIMERTPYNKDGSSSWAEQFAELGYAAIAQDTRGRYGSEGVWHMMTDDPNDGHDTAAWIVQQPWSDGGFATRGTSYPGGTQHALALTDPPGLKAMIPVDAVSNCGYFGFRNGGAFELRFMNWIVQMESAHGSRAAKDPATQEALQEAGTHIREYLLALPFRKGATPIRLAPEYEDWLVFAMGHGEN